MLSTAPQGNRFPAANASGTSSLPRCFPSQVRGAGETLTCFQLGLKPSFPPVRHRQTFPILFCSPECEIVLNSFLFFGHKFPFQRGVGLLSPLQRMPVWPTYRQGESRLSPTKGKRSTPVTGSGVGRGFPTYPFASDLEGKT